MVARIEEKKHLSAKGLLTQIRKSFSKIKDPEKGKGSRSPNFSLVDCLMSGLAIFSLKFPSLLQFDQQRNKEIIQHNLNSLYQVQRAPCETYLRERLDNIDPREIRGAFTQVFSILQRGKSLENFQFIEGHYLLLCDGTGFFSSKNVYCQNCCEKNHRDGTITYSHMMLGSVIAHPDHKDVIPLCPEPIMKTDGEKKMIVNVMHRKECLLTCAESIPIFH